MLPARAQGSCPSPPTFGRQDSLLAAAAALGPLTLYAFTMPRTVVLEDDGLFLMAGAHLGIAHPPGYPLHTLLLHAFLQLPFGSPAMLGHLSSAILAALACGAVYVCARQLGGSGLPALSAAWLFGASEHVWSQAIVTEVYSLHTLLFFLLWALLREAVRRPGNWRLLAGAALCYGLSLANHWPLLLLATPGFALLALPAWRSVLRRLPQLVGLAAAGAALPYAWMVWRSQQAPAISFYGSIDSFGDLWFYVGRQGYSAVDASPSAGWSDRLAFLEWLGHEFVWQLTPAGFALAALGLAALCRRREFAAAAGAAAALLGQSVLLALLLAFDFDYFNVAVFRPYSVVCYGLLALWTAVGLQALADGAVRWLPGALGRFRGATAGAAGLALAAASVQAHWPLNDRSGSEFARRFADMAFDRAEPGAAILAYDDVDTGVLGYYRFVENERPDILLLNTQGLVFSNRLYRFSASKERRNALLLDRLSGAGRQVVAFSAGTDALRCPECKVLISGFATEFRPDAGAASIQLTFDPQGERFFRYLLAEEFVDHWEYMISRKMLHRWGEFLGWFTTTDLPQPPERIRAMIALAEGDYHSLIGMMSAVLGTVLETGLNAGPEARRERIEQVRGWLAKAERLPEPVRLRKDERALLLYIRGFLRYLDGDRQGAAALFRDSIRAYDHPKNPAQNALRKLRAGG